MSPAELQAFAQGLIDGQSFWYVLSPMVAAATAYWGAYSAEKAKNRATKDDIKEITTKVEEVRNEFNTQLANLNAHHQLRLLAAERRMQAHQDASYWWNKLFCALTASDETFKELHKQAENWFRKNDLFLGKETRSAFFVALCGFTRHRIYWRLDDLEKLYEVNKEIMSLFPVLHEEVSLPPLSSHFLQQAHEHLKNPAAMATSEKLAF